VLASPPSAGGAIDGARIYVPLQSQQVAALDRATGETVWTADVDTALPPLALEDRVFVAAGDELHAFDASNGERLWRVEMDRDAMAPLGSSRDRVIALVNPDEVWAFRPFDGHRYWRRELGGITGPARMALSGDAVYVAAGGRIVCIELETGGIRWERELPGTLGEPYFARDRVVVGSDTGGFYALDGRSGNEKWHWDAGGSPVGAAGELDLIFLTSLDNTLKAVNRGNGHQRWRQPLPTRPATPPRAFGGIVVAIGLSPTLSTFVAKTGLPVGTYVAPAELMGPPLIDPPLRPLAVGLVLILRDGAVVALRPVTLMFRELPVTPLATLPGRLLTREPQPGAGRPR
jgi:outer membrane protein assembly factor BamB